MKNSILIFIGVLAVVSCEINKGDQSSPIPDPFGPQEFVGKHKARVSVLGLFHFSNPGLDSYKPKFSFDILSGEHQKELDLVLDALEKFRPTKILVENPRVSEDSVLTASYKGYLNDTFDISKRTSETYQVGFKLAKRLGHQKVYASDTEPLEWCGITMDRENYDEEAYLRSTGNLEKSRRYDYLKKSRFEDSLKTEIPLKEYLSFINKPSNRLKNHQGYLTELSLIGAGDWYNGADAMARWYRRNIRIFANTYDITDLQNEEHILLIYGSGHVHTLRQMFMDSPDFEYVEINDYLN